MKLSVIVLLIVIISCNFVQEADAHWWGGLGWGGLGWGGLGWGGLGWGGLGWNRPWGWNSWGWNRPWGWNSWGWNRPWGRPWGWGKRSVESSEFSVNCEWKESSKLLSCSGLNKTIECESVRLFDREIASPFQLFAVSSVPFGGLQTKPEEVKFSLYPQKLDKSGFCDTKVVDPVLKKSFTYSLYHLPEYTDSGFRVERPECWRRFIDLFSDFSLRVESLPVLRENGKSEDVKVLGRLAVL